MEETFTTGPERIPEEQRNFRQVLGLIDQSVALAERLGEAVTLELLLVALMTFVRECPMPAAHSTIVN